jgi:predicted AAA+ superfamily ATPase
MDKLEQFLTRAEALLGRLEGLLPPAPADVDWNAATAFRWRKRQGAAICSRCRRRRRSRWTI